MTEDRAEYKALMVNPLAINAVRARQKREGRTLRIPLFCSDHRAGVSIMLTVNNEIADQGSNEKSDVRYVEDHLLMFTAPDIHADSPGTAVEDKRRAWSIKDPSAVSLEEMQYQESHGDSFTICCGTCGRSIRRRRGWLLRAAIERVVKAGSDDPKKSGWRISIT